LSRKRQIFHRYFGKNILKNHNIGPRNGANIIFNRQKAKSQTVTKKTCAQHWFLVLRKAPFYFWKLGEIAENSYDNICWP
jgi:hypothetical protein